jgi:hypothetical protein
LYVCAVADPQKLLNLKGRSDEHGFETWPGAVVGSGNKGRNRGTAGTNALGHG